MRYHHLLQQSVEHHKEKRERQGKEAKIDWWQLSLIGIGSIIGAGFFLGTGLSIHLAGPSILFAYLFGGITAFLVFSALAEMSANDPNPGSFRVYAKKAFGHRMGFISGWMYWVAGVLIMSSEITALSIFTRFWFPHFPLWGFAIFYSLLGLGINFMGVSSFGKIESVFAMIKIIALLLFILLGVAAVIGILPVATSSAALTKVDLTSFEVWFPHHFSGMWSAMLFVLFSYGGIAVVGIASNELRNKRTIFLAGNVLQISLTSLYVLSICMVLILVSWKDVNGSSSPFVAALRSFHLPYISSLLNFIIISAAFSTMVGALFSISNVMVSLALDGDAPKRFSQTNAKGVATGALLLSGLGLAGTIVLSYLLPKTVYVFITTAAGLMLIMNWLIILSSQLKIRYTAKKLGNTLPFHMFGFPYASWAGMLFILFAISGSFLHKEERVGFFVSIIILIIIVVGYFFSKHRRSQHHV